MTGRGGGGAPEREGDRGRRETDIEREGALDIAGECQREREERGRKSESGWGGGEERMSWGGGERVREWGGGRASETGG